MDIFAAEMAQWTRGPGPDTSATARILYGDGKGSFRKTVPVEGHGRHEGRLADLDGDGDLDVPNKPYTWEAPRLDIWLNNGTGERIRAGMDWWTYTKPKPPRRSARASPTSIHQPQPSKHLASVGIHALRRPRQFGITAMVTFGEPDRAEA